MCEPSHGTCQLTVIHDLLLSPARNMSFYLSGELCQDSGPQVQRRKLECPVNSHPIFYSRALQRLCAAIRAAWMGASTQEQFRSLWSMAHCFAPTVLGPTACAHCFSLAEAGPTGASRTWTTLHLRKDAGQRSASRASCALPPRSKLTADGLHPTCLKALLEPNIAHSPSDAPWCTWYNQVTLRDMVSRSTAKETIRNAEEAQCKMHLRFHEKSSG